MRLVLNSNRDDDHELFVMDGDGSARAPMSDNHGDDGYAVWGQ